MLCIGVEAALKARCALQLAEWMIEGKRVMPRGEGRA
jgi:hypothetical protein